MQRYVSKSWPIVSLVLLFALSILIRAPWFNLDYMGQMRYTGERFTNTEVFSHLNYVFNVYDKYSVQEHLFASYIGPDPSFLQSRFIPEAIYTSFPPTLFAIPYILFHFLGHHSFLDMQIFNLAIELICILLIYYLAFLLTKNKLISVLGATLYLFMTGTLQNHMNVYWAHQLLQPFFFVSLILFVRRRGLLKWWEALMIGFILSIITWTGVMAVVGFLLYGGYKFFKSRNRAYLNYLYMLGGAIGALGLILTQNLFVTGSNVQGYAHQLTRRAEARSITGNVLTMLFNFFRSLFIDCGGTFLIVGWLALKEKLKGFEWEVMFVASFPVLESFVLLEHDTAYGFGRLKWLFPFILLFCILGAKFATTRKNKILLCGAAVVVCVVYALVFTVIYRLLQ